MIEFSHQQKPINFLTTKGGPNLFKPPFVKKLNTKEL